MDAAKDVFAELDGRQIQNVMGRFRTPSSLFTFGPLPEDNLVEWFGFTAPEGSTSPSVSEGYYVLLAPLSPGMHTLHFGGTFGAPFNFTLDVTYTLTSVIEPPSRGLWSQ